LLSSGFAATRTASVSGNWNNPATWGGNPIPTSADDVIVPLGFTVTITANAVARKVDIYGTLEVNKSVSLTVEGDLNIEGTFTMKSGGGQTLVVKGDLTNNGNTNLNQADVIVVGNFISPSTSTLQNQGNLVIGGNASGIVDQNGGTQVYLINPNAENDLTTTPAPITTLPTDPVLIDLINQYINSSSCGITINGPLNADNCNGGIASFTISSVTPTGTYSYQWYENKGIGWTALTNTGVYSGVNTTVLSITNPPLVMDQYLYQCKVTSVSCPGGKTSYSATLTVSSAVTTPVFTLGPTSFRCIGAGSVSYTATATNSTGITYSLDATSLANGNSIVAGTGTVTYAAGWSGTSIITASAAGCGGPSTAIHTVTIASSVVWNGTVSTDWNLPGNWSCGFIPGITSPVLIPNVVNQPILSTGAIGTALNIIIANGASITVTGNTLQIAGTIANSGTFNATAGTIEMKGTVAQTIGAGIFSGNTIMNLTINNSAGVALLGPLTVTGIVNAINGNLSSGGNLTLASTAVQTALIDGTGIGGVTGNVTMQRYLPSGFGYKYFSSPFQAATVNEFADDLNLAASFPTFYDYDEDNHRDSSGIAIYTSGWVKYITASNLLVPMRGYAANFGNVAAPKTVDITGVVNNNLALTQTLYNHNRKYTKGFNLQGNPYPSPIDWDASNGWTKTNIDNAIYFFDNGTTDEYTGTYSSYINGVSSNGIAGNIISSMQGFFIHVSDVPLPYPVTATLGMNNQVRINNLAPAFHKSAHTQYIPKIRLKAAFESQKKSDPAVVYFSDAASSSFDQMLDALKLMNTDYNTPNLYTMTPQAEKLSISAIPFPSDSTRVPLGLKTEQEGWVTFTASEIDDIPGGLHIYLTDELTGLIQNLQVNPTYRVQLKSGVFENRFALIFSEKDMEYKAKEKDTFYASINNGKLNVFIELASEKKALLKITNTAGLEILKQNLVGDGLHEINHQFTAAMYILNLYTDNGISSFKIYIPNE